MPDPINRDLLWIGVLTYCAGVFAFVLTFAWDRIAGLDLVLVAVGMACVCLYVVPRRSRRPDLRAWQRDRRPLQTSFHSLDDLRHLPHPVQTVLADAQRIRRFLRTNPVRMHETALWLLWDWRARLRRASPDLRRLLHDNAAPIQRSDQALARLFDPGSAGKKDAPPWQAVLLEVDDALWRLIEAFADRRIAYR